MRQLNVLVVDPGARGHALAWKLAQSPRCKSLSIASGNAGTAELGHNVPLNPTDIGELAWYAKRSNIDLTIVGSDDALAVGLVDAFRAMKLRVIGPTQVAAQVEWSKWYAKTLMLDLGIPTAAAKTFTDFNLAVAYLNGLTPPIVVKADGLARGKGVTICASVEEAAEALIRLMIERVHGDAGQTVLIEEFLDGPELSLHALTDGATVAHFPASQDYKQLRAGSDRGPNTGGMGAYAPLAWVTEETSTAMQRTIIEPVLEELRRRQTPFTGCLYPGIAMTAGGPRVIELNARFGDPETQVYVRLLASDLLEVFDALADGRLDRVPLTWHEGFAVCVVLASAGYPEASASELPIIGLEEAARVPSVVIFHAGTIRQHGILLTNGGRVLSVTATGATLEQTTKRVYRAVNAIHFEGMQYRSDIGRLSVETA